MLASSEVNAAGGILGREVELVFADAGGDPATVADMTVDLIAENSAEAVIGMHISAVRVALVRALRGRVPYVYTPVYEGGERSPGLFMVGETPAQQLKPAIHWLAEQRGARRWYLVGNDYIWPHVSHRAARRYIKASGGAVVGIDYVPFGCEDLEDPSRAHPQGAPGRRAGLDGRDRLRRLQSRLCPRGPRAAHAAAVGCQRGEHAARHRRAQRGEFLLHGRLSGGARHAGQPGVPRSLSCGVRPGGADAEHDRAILLRGHPALRRACPPRRLARRGGASRVSEGLAYTGARGRVTMRSRHLLSDIYLAEADGLTFRILAHFPAPSA